MGSGIRGQITPVLKASSRRWRCESSPRQLGEQAAAVRATAAVEAAAAGLATVGELAPALALAVVAAAVVAVVAAGRQKWRRRRLECTS